MAHRPPAPAPRWREASGSAIAGSGSRLRRARPARGPGMAAGHTPVRRLSASMHSAAHPANGSSGSRTVCTPLESVLTDSPYRVAANQMIVNRMELKDRKRVVAGRQQPSYAERPDPNCSGAARRGQVGLDEEIARGESKATRVILNTPAKLRAVAEHFAAFPPPGGGGTFVLRRSLRHAPVVRAFRRIKHSGHMPTPSWVLEKGSADRPSRARRA
jgi:hypothetical protein